ncbi:MmyB family transcriptional regulator [Actinoplanes sp. RD1]|uniref:MmyB family transcriptional regulator n=1 Tax=Actinoplanes sp. RD1 TaxID=3064538 RepID=UPI0027420BFA|nr:hypothetical protein [Actinoplanes sp. RD1]
MADPADHLGPEHAAEDGPQAEHRALALTDDERRPDDAALTALIGELIVKSPEFAACWAKHPVQVCGSGTKHLHHPVVGDLELQFEALHLPGDDGHRLLTYSAAPNSSDEAALHLLSACAGEGTLVRRS